MRELQEWYSCAFQGLLSEAGAQFRPHHPECWSRAEMAWQERRKQHRPITCAMGSSEGPVTPNMIKILISLVENIWPGIFHSLGVFPLKDCFVLQVSGWNLIMAHINTNFLTGWEPILDHVDTYDPFHGMHTHVKTIPALYREEDRGHFFLLETLLEKWEGEEHPCGFGMGWHWALQGGQQLMDHRGLGLAGGMSSCAVFASVNCSGNIFEGF